jgi:pectate lyase
VGALRFLCGLLLIYSTGARAAVTTNACTPAFPGAQGYGALATGGNGSPVLHVTNLNDSGPGSFRDAVSSGHRCVVFDLAGTVALKSGVSISSDITVDGTKGPAPGITFSGQSVSVSRSQNVILRNLRFREGINGPRGKCSLQGTDCSNIIVDHCSIEWGRWDCMEFTGKSHDITVQYCIIGEGEEPQRFGFLLNGEDRISVHHNLFIDNHSRNPKLKANAQYINNVIYNWGVAGLVGGHSEAPWRCDVIGNYAIAGPSSKGSWVSQCTSNDIWFVSDNWKNLSPSIEANPVLVPGSEFIQQGVTLSLTNFHYPAIPVTIDPPARLYIRAASGTYGCQPSDDVDRRLSSSLTGAQKWMGPP